MNDTAAVRIVDAVERRLHMLLWTRAIVAGLGAALVVLLVWRVTAPWHGESPRLALALALLAGVATAWLMRRRAGAMSPLRAALWIEEQTPTGYAVVTLADPAASSLSPAMRGALSDAAVRATSTSALTPRFTALFRRSLTGPVLFAVAALAVLLAAPRVNAADGVPRGASPDGLTARAGTDRPLGAWRVRVVPPAYTGRRAQDLGDAGTVRVLAGSQVEVRVDASDGVPDAAARTIEAAGATRAWPVRTAATGDDWRAAFIVPLSPVELRATRGGATRLLLADAYGDSIPRALLRRPARDTVLRRATGRMPLEATLHDDIGLVSASFELIVSSGEGERFTAKTVSVGARALRGAGSATLAATLDLGALGLGPGDVVHLRAIARDGNPGGGREAGSSETRSFRIARQSEYDSVAVEPAPPPAVDSSLLSQRMLLMLTERLERRRPSLARPTLVSESGRLARDQARLRQSVGSVVFQRLSGEQGAEHAHFAGDGHEHAANVADNKLALPGRDANGGLDEGDDSPIIAINRPLLEAYNAMWDAGRALEQAEPRAAIPHMRLALAAIERARAASRLYLRGKPPTVIIDLAKVRLAGKDTGVTNVRSARSTLDAASAAREARLLAHAALLTRDAGAGRDSLAVLRLESVADAPAFAAALSAALDDLRARRDLTPALLRARRALGGVQAVGGDGWSRAGFGPASGRIP